MSIELSLKSAYVEITDKCNLFCKHCYNDSKYHNNNFLSHLAIKNIYEDLSGKKINQISISGGEPLLHPEISNIFLYAHNYKIKTQIVTNGVLLSNYIEDINNNPYLTIQVSIDGIGRSHDLLRNSKIFDIVDFNLNFLNRNIEMSINTSLNKHNLLELEDIVEYAVCKGAKTIAFSPLNSQGRSLLNKDIHITNDELRKAIEIISNLSIKYEGKINIKPIKINYSQCPFSLSSHADISPRIDVYGNVFLCSMFTNPMFSIGNIYKSGLLEAINSDRCKIITDFLYSFKCLIECQSCILNNVCQKGCLAQYLNNFPSYSDDLCKFKKGDFFFFLNKNIADLPQKQREYNN